MAYGRIKEVHLYRLLSVSTQICTLKVKLLTLFHFKMNKLIFIAVIGLAMLAAIVQAEDEKAEGGAVTKRGIHGGYGHGHGGHHGGHHGGYGGGWGWTGYNSGYGFQAGGWGWPSQGWGGNSYQYSYPTHGHGHGHGGHHGGYGGWGYQG